MTTESSLVLIVEDDRAIRKITRTALLASAYPVIEATTGRSALANASDFHPDVILLDLGLPDITGLEVIRQLGPSQTSPIVVFSAGASLGEIFAALDAGAVDFISKPFDLHDLLSRLCTALRCHGRRERRAASHFTFGDLTFDVLADRVTVGDREVRLTSDESQLLCILAKNSGRLLTERFLIHAMSELSPAIVEFQLPLIIAGLRHKLKIDPLRPQYFLSEIGIGYRFRDR